MKYQQTYKTNVDFQNPNSDIKGLPFQLLLENGFYIPRD